MNSYFDTEFYKGKNSINTDELINDRNSYKKVKLLSIKETNLKERIILNLGILGILAYLLISVIEKFTFRNLILCFFAFGFFELILGCYFIVIKDFKRLKYLTTLEKC
jgi:hypothetical protein